MVLNVASRHSDKRTKDRFDEFLRGITHNKAYYYYLVGCYFMMVGQVGRLLRRKDGSATSATQSNEALLNDVENIIKPVFRSPEERLLILR